MRLDLATRTLFSEFQEHCFTRVALEHQLKATGTFVRKKIKEKEYWYVQQYTEGKITQQYYGSADKGRTAEIMKTRAERQRQQAMFKKIRLQEARQAAMLRRGGVPSLDSRFEKVLLLLSQIHMIDEGGVLIGSLAFQAYAGMLGALFQKTSLRTNDLDVVFDASIAAVPSKPVDVLEVFQNAGVVLRAIPQLSPKALPTSFVTEDGIRLDFLTPQKGKPRGGVSVRGVINAQAVDLPYLDFLLSETCRTVLLGPKGGIPVHIPAPAFFAIHKLIVANRRPIVEQAKQKKDLEQAEALIQILMEEQPQELRDALKKARKMSKKAHQAIDAMSKRLSEKIQKMFTRVSF